MRLFKGLGGAPEGSARVRTAYLTCLFVSTASVPQRLRVKPIQVSRLIRSGLAFRGARVHECTVEEQLAARASPVRMLEETWHLANGRQDQGTSVTR